MGCRLPKLRKAEERQSPGKIYSTLRRPQVETKVGVAYTYHFLDFLLGKEEVAVSSVLCLSSVRELPVQVRELYAQGFVLVALHPFVHPCGPRHARIQRQLHRAVLLRETPQSSEKSQLKWAGHHLETDVCVSGQQAPDPEAIQNYVKKIQDVSDQGVTFVGFLQQPGGGPCFLGPWDPEDLSSLHSSPSPIHRHAFSSGSSPSDPAQPSRDASDPERTPSDQAGTSPEDPGGPTGDPDYDPSCPVPGQNCRPAPEEELRAAVPHDPTHSTTIPQDPRRAHPDKEGAGGPTHICGEVLRASRGLCPLASAESPDPGPPGDHYSPPGAGRRRAEGRLADPADTHPGSPLLEPGAPEENGNLGYREGQDHERVEASLNNNNHVWNTKSSEEKAADPLPPVGAHTLGRTQLFALYNHTGELENSSRFYSLRVPLCIQKEAGLTTEVDAHWLDHMTQHFTSGARLIDGFFHLADDNDSGISSVDSVFIFQSPAEESTATSYDAIVVEQWTVVDGVVVRTDYIPLLQSLAPYGWRLMCVLPTPVVRTNSDGSLSTKQILFLQRPTLQRKRKDFKMLNLRGRSKARKSYSSETPEKERESASPVSESEVDELLGNTREEEDEEEEGGLMVEEEEREEKRCQGAGTWGGEEAIMKEAELQTDSSPPLSEGGGVSDGNQEEECAEVDWASTAKQEKSVRWTDVCQRADSGLEEEMKDRIKPQLSERALFSGVC
ncbi:raftlin isoform X1 [Gadus morhua]|uniref:Raftlin, lipid raft linker 1 n=1 Tax=Gadus morhua TaxID=8049 RepID=A0A8C4ZD20_GADMO|nr:raftlin-like isoform X1 [Gadus morhua]